MKKAFINIGLLCAWATVTALSINACGNRPATLTANSLAVPTATPDYNSTTSDFTMTTDWSSQNATVQESAIPNVQVGTFKVDQDMANQWQAKGLAVSSGTIYLTVADTSGLLKKGSIVKMDSSSGKTWKEIGATWLGLKHPVDSTVQGITVFGGNIIAVEPSKIYTLDTSASAALKVTVATGGTDIASGGGAVFVSNGSTVDKTDSSISSKATISGMTSSGGIGADSYGAVYSVSGTTVKKAEAQGTEATDIITSGLTSPIDVAVDSRSGDIYVLDSTMVRRFNSNGQIISEFASQATKPIAIAVDEQGAVYVADTGSDYKDSKVIKFSAVDVDSSSSSFGSTTNSSNTSNSSTYNNSSTSSSGTSSSYSGGSVSSSSVKKSSTGTTNKTQSRFE